MSNTQNDLRREYVKKLKELNLDDPDFDVKFGQINESLNPSQSRSNNRDNVDNLEEQKYQSPRQGHGHQQRQRQQHNRHNDHQYYNPMNIVTSFDRFFDNPFNSLSRVHNRLYNMMNKHFTDNLTLYDKDKDKDKDKDNDNDNVNENDSDKDNDELFFNKGEFDEKKLDNLDVNTYQNTDKSSNSPKPNYYKYISSMTTYDNNGIRKAKSISRTEKYDGKHKSVKQVSKFQDGDKYVEEHLNPDGTTRRIEKKIDNDTRMIQK